MILELDAGNSRVKWRAIGEAGETVHSGALNSPEELGGLLPGEEITRVRMACVANAAHEQLIVERVRQGTGLVPEVARTRMEHNGLRIAYEDPQRLGVDRWLAMLAARSHTAAPVCVIDCGSAVTIDLVEADGTHLGGYIVPGLRLQREALLRDTGQVRMIEATSEQANAWGRSTEEAVNHGINRMLSSLLDSVLAELAEAEPGVQIYFTGGDAVSMMRNIAPGLPCREIPELVLDGLAIALP